MYRLYHNNRDKCPALIPVFDDCCNYYMDRGLHVEGKLSDEIGVLSPEIGDIKMSARQDNYEGWLVCDGRDISRETYSALFSIIGTLFGSGDGQNTFNIPDSRGRVPLGAQQSSGTSYYCVGNSGGAETHTLTINEMPIHNHGVNDSGHTHTATSINDDFNNTGTYLNFNTPSYAQNDGSGSITWTSTINSSTTGISIQNNGGGLAHNNMQPYWVFGNYFIYCGVKDSRKEGCNDSFPVQPCIN
jgi:microcystin-dependent protein